MKKPVINNIEPVGFLKERFCLLIEEKARCPNCGKITSLINLDKANEIECKKERDNFYKFIFAHGGLGLCSEACAKEFLGGIYDAYK